MVEIYREDGTSVVTFTYDAYGNFTEEYGTEANSLEKLIATSTPFRYRGYTYDQETGLYYLNSRYYDPKVGRFISADDIGVITATPEGLTDKNLYAYCDNNPVMRVDNGGEFWNLIIGAVVGAVVSAAVSFVSQLLDDEAPSITSGEFWGHVGVAAATGAVSGAVAASGVGLVGQIAVNATLGATGAVADTAIDDKGDTSIETYLLKATEGAVIGTIAGAIGGQGSASKHVSNSFKRVIKNRNWRYYYSQIRRESFKDGVKAIPSIFKSYVPNIAKSALKLGIQYGG